MNVTTVTTQVPINANKVKKRKKQRTILSSWGISQPCLDALPTLGCVALGATLATFVGPASQCNNASFQGYQSTMYLHSNAAIHAQTWCNMVSWSAARSTSRTGDRLARHSNSWAASTLLLFSSKQHLPSTSNKAKPESDSTLLNWVA